MLKLTVLQHGLITIYINPTIRIKPATNSLIGYDIHIETNGIRETYELTKESALNLIERLKETADVNQPITITLTLN